MSGAISGNGIDFTFAAAADLSSYQYCFVYLTADLTVNMSGLNARAIGILQNKDADAAGKACIVRLLGVSKLIAGEEIAVSKMITSTAAGRGEIADAADEWCPAFSLTAAAADGDEMTVLLGGGFDAVSSDA